MLVRIVGSGAMGIGIAQVFAAAGHEVELTDQEKEIAIKAKAGLEKQLARLVEMCIRDRHTTVTVERSICRLLGIDGVDQHGVPYPNVVVEHLVERELIGYGAFNLILDAAAAYQLTPQQVAEGIADQSIDLSHIPSFDPLDRDTKRQKLITDAVSRIKRNREFRDQRVEERCV